MNAILQPIVYRTLFPKRIFLARHGQSEWNKLSRVTGQSDPALAEAGREQAQNLGTVLRGVALDAIYASTLTRALHTAAPVAEQCGVAVQAMADLREQHMGVLQGRFRDERDPEAQAIWAARAADRARHRVPGGESWLELKARAGRALAEISRAHADGTVLLVAHRNTNRALLATVFDLADAQAVALKISSARLLEIDTLQGEAWSISLRAGEVGRRRPWRPE